MSNINNIKVSVIVPVYNSEETLEQSISSLLNQTLKEIEIIIVNDGSTDSSPCIINEFAESRKNITSIHFSYNQGVHAARKAGVMRASAPWIGFLDADDIARPSMFETLHLNAELQDVDIVICGSYRVTKGRKPIYPETLFINDKKYSNLLLKRFTEFNFGPVSLWNKLYKKEIILPAYQTRFPWRQDIHEDCLVNFGCFLQASSIYIIKDYLHEYLFNNNSCTSTMTQPNKFVGTYSAYAIAVNLYHNRGQETLKIITEMFRMLIDSREFSIDNLSDLDNYSQIFCEATNLVNKNYPEGLALIAARPMRANSHRRLFKYFFGNGILAKTILSLARTWRAQRLSFKSSRP